MTGVPLALHPTLSSVPFPAHLEPLLVKIAELVCDVFGDDSARRFRWMDSGHPKFAVLEGTLERGHCIKLTVTDQATVVVFYLAGMPIKELDRITLRNESWTDFVGWMSQVKTRYDEILAQ